MSNNRNAHHSASKINHEKRTYEGIFEGIDIANQAKPIHSRACIPVILKFNRLLKIEKITNR